jgi:menaquinone-dependent protoporphyrinogen IX oxidase
MSKILVMYHSVNGTTKRYAEWLSEELNGDLCNIKDVKSDMLSDYDMIILGSPILAGTIKGLNLLSKNKNLIKDKKIVFYSCGILDVSNEEIINEIRDRVEKDVPKEVFEQMKIFSLRGGFDHYNLNIFYRIAFWFAKKQIEKKPTDKLSKDELFVLECYGKSIDFTNKESIEPIVEYCR